MFIVGLVEEVVMYEKDYPRRYEIVIEPSDFIDSLVLEALKGKPLIVEVKGIGFFEYKGVSK